MRAATFCYGSPETRLTNSVFADLYHHYGIPQWSTVGSDSHVFDQQAAIEHAFGILMAALDGSNLIHDVGYLGQGLIQNPAMLVMCNEIIGYVKRIVRGLELRPDFAELDIIQKVGPGGHYLAEEHTLRHFRHELWQPTFLNHDNLNTWQQKGSKTYGETVIHKTLEILEKHTPEPPPDDVQRKIEAIVDTAEKALADLQFRA
jgi:trimethylamine--corrinoid protein Co-methyltransferase